MWQKRHDSQYKQNIGYISLCFSFFYYEKIHRSRNDLSKKLHYYKLLNLLLEIHKKWKKENKKETSVYNQDMSIHMLLSFLKLKVVNM